MLLVYAAFSVGGVAGGSWYESTYIQDEDTCTADEVAYMAV
jgi:hypothetical protein